MPGKKTMGQISL